MIGHFASTPLNVVSGVLDLEFWKPVVDLNHIHIVHFQKIIDSNGAYDHFGNTWVFLLLTKQAPSVLVRMLGVIGNDAIVLRGILGVLVDHFSEISIYYLIICFKKAVP